MSRLDKVKRTGQRLLITRKGEPIAEITPPSPRKASAGWLGSLRSSGRITGDIVSSAASVPPTGMRSVTHHDPAGRLIVATALVYELTLVTADKRLVKGRHVAVLANR